MTSYIADERFFRIANAAAAAIDPNQPPCPFVVDRIIEALVEADICPLSIAADVIKAEVEHAEAVMARKVAEPLS